MISPMRFTQIIGPQGLFDHTLDVIQQAGVLQIEEVPLAEGGGDSLLQRVHLTDAQSQRLATYESLVQLVDEEVLRYTPPEVVQTHQNSPAYWEAYRAWSDEDDHATATAVRTLHAEVRSFRRRQRNMEDDLRILSAYEEVTKVLVPALETQETIDHYEYLGVVFERKSQRVRNLLEKEVHTRCAGACVFYQANISKGRVAALIGFAPEHDATVREIIGQTGISEVRGPRYLRGKSFRDIMTVLPRDLQRLRGQVQVLNKRKHAFFAEKGALLLALHGVCHDRLSRLIALSKFAQSRFTFIMEGWVPTESLDNLQTTLKQKCGPDITLRKIRPHGAAGSPPVLLKNTLAIKPFQSLLKLLPLPKYGSIDPTSYVAVFFPPMFGLMLGDIGYGLILGFMTLWLWHFSKRSPAARPFVLIAASLTFFTIAFGFVFGEFFGDFGHQLGLHPLWRERLVVGSPQMGSTLLIYLLFSIALGVVHVFIGLILGIVSAYRTGKTTHALEKIAKIVGIIGLFFVVGRLTDRLPVAFTSLSVVMLIAFVTLMIRTILRDPLHGSMLPLELLGTVGNILSYARIMAVGMASAVLAFLANTFGRMIDSVILATIVVILVHALNMVLGIVDPTIQGLRLHYVEFFSKFYEGGGRAYTPFKTLGGKLP